MGKNLLRGRMRILGQIPRDLKEKEKAEELINLILQGDVDFKRVKKRMREQELCQSAKGS